MVGSTVIGMQLLPSVRSPPLNKAVTLLHFQIDGKVLASSNRLKSLISIGAMHSAESFNSRAGAIQSYSFVSF